MENRKRLRESGSVIIEASFIFPIAFFVLAILIYMGNAYYIRSRVDRIVVEYAVMGAKYCADPMLQYIEEYGSVPTLGSDNEVIEPYGFIFDSNSDLEDEITEEIISKTLKFLNFPLINHTTLYKKAS